MFKNFSFYKLPPGGSYQCKASLFFTKHCTAHSTHECINIGSHMTNFKWRVRHGTTHPGDLARSLASSTISDQGDSRRTSTRPPGKRPHTHPRRLKKTVPGRWRHKMKRRPRSRRLSSVIGQAVRKVTKKANNTIIRISFEKVVAVAAPCATSCRSLHPPNRLWEKMMVSYHRTPKGRRGCRRRSRDDATLSCCLLSSG